MQCSLRRSRLLFGITFQLFWVFLWNISGWHVYVSTIIVVIKLFVCTMRTFLLLFTCCAFVSEALLQDLPPPCSSEIYCYGKIIDSVMSYHIFNDSKTFVDLKLKKPPNETLELFDTFLEKFSNNPTKDQLQAWVEENFDPKGSELIEWKPVDHKTELDVYNRINDKNFKKFASDLNDIWIQLSRRMKDEVKVSSFNYLSKQFHSIAGVHSRTTRS